MATLIAGAIVLGSVSSFLMGFVPFFFALLTAIVLGIGTASVGEVPLGSLLLPGLLLLVTTQLAYGLGLLGQFGLSHLASAWDRSPGIPLPSPARRPKTTPADENADPLQNR